MHTLGCCGGGESGAFSRCNVDRFNRQLHAEEKALAKKLVKKARLNIRKRKSKIRRGSWVCPIREMGRRHLERPKS